MATSNSVLPAEQIGRAPMGSWTGADPNSPAPRRSLAPGRPSLRAAFLVSPAPMGGVETFKSDRGPTRASLSRKTGATRGREPQQYCGWNGALEILAEVSNAHKLEKLA